ncbi:MAG: DNA-processing protein DprA [candidate division KSB1 bacterium]|nr:DNA-processing protein DprA [candidate division KSB1 bacterium]MDZ7345572.1 DNA-processing protein DprA [candidate division KSB1 bacterium]
MTAEDAVAALDVLYLMTIPGLGSFRIRNLIKRFKTVQAVLAASVRELVEIEGIDKTLAMQIKRGGDQNFVEKQAEKIRSAGALLISYWDPHYPQLLRRIADPPLLLFVKGKVETIGALSVAIVGTRSPSGYGKIMAEKFSSELAQRGITIVSGLARGIDTIVHAAVVRTGGKTVAVLGSGVDVIYPEENKRLTEQIVQNGALISEFPMGTKPDAPHFPRRNRIVSGMCRGVLVIEAGEKSGALITADAALEQGREVFALPGNINNPKSCGCNRLIQEGAKLVTSVEDILDEIGISSSQPTPSEPSIPLTSKEKSVVEVLTHEPIHIDKIASLCRMPVGEVLGILLSLELKNLVRQTPGKHFLRQ